MHGLSVGSGPLASLRVLELASAGPGPHAAMLLADLGADVVVVENPGRTQKYREVSHMLQRNARVLEIDLKDATGQAAARELAIKADVLIEGFRPGVAEKLGLGPDELLGMNPRLVYGRVTGWGQDGPWSHKAGHDINYLAVTGLLRAMGDSAQCPQPPLNLVADFGGGSMLLCLGVLSALLERGASGQGQIIDASMMDGALSLGQMLWSLRALGTWSDRRGTNAFDGSLPYYRTYRCADGEFVAVGALEEEFYFNLLSLLGLEPEAIPQRDDHQQASALHQIFADRFGSRTRDEWAAIAEKLDCCVTPVLSLDEAAEHHHVQSRMSVVEVDGVRQAAPVPRFSRSKLVAPVARSHVSVPDGAVWG